MGGMFDCLTGGAELAACVSGILDSLFRHISGAALSVSSGLTPDLPQDVAAGVTGQGMSWLRSVLEKFFSFADPEAARNYLDMIVEEMLPVLTRGLYKSILVIVPSALFGLLLGIAVGTARVFGWRWLRAFCNGYTVVFRGIPLVVQLFILYFGLTNLSFLIHMFDGTSIGDYFASRGITKFGIYLEPYTAAVLGFTLCSAAYHSEYVRGALLSIRQGQIRAAEALGFSGFSTLCFIVIPQAFRRALPGCGNEIIYLIKYSSLAYVITFMELTGEAKNFAARTYYYTEVFFFTGVYYLVLVSIAGVLLKRLENKLYIPGFGHSKS